MRVLQVTPYYEDAWAYGGIPRVVAATSRGLAGRGHRVTVCTTDACDRGRRLHGAAPRTPPDPSVDGVEVRIFRNLSNRLAYHLQLFVPFGLGRFLASSSDRFDVAHLHACHNLPAAIAARLLRRAGVPYVLTPNGTAERIERRRLGKLLFDATCGRGLLPGAARVIAVSQAERSRLVAMGMEPSRLAVVPNPIDDRDLAAAPDGGRFRERLGIAAGLEVVLYLGKLTPRKRVDVLIDAFARLDRPRTHLVIAGNDLGAGGALRRRVQKRRLDARTTFTGLLCGGDRLCALAAADVVVYPGRDEAFGLVAVEALLSGTPVVVADDHGCGELVRRLGGGLVAAEGDAAAFARGIGSVLSRPAPWQREVRTAVSRVRSELAADRVCERLEALYRAVMVVPAAAAADPVRVMAGGDRSAREPVRERRAGACERLASGDGGGLW